MLIEFIQNFKSTVLASIDSDNHPFTSYAPFIYNNHQYYIFISDIARHSQNIQNNPNISLFFIEDEQTCETIFARKRVQLSATAKQINKKSPTFNEILDLFEAHHGATVKTLRTMQDFNLYEITPLKGEAVFGFGQAYDVGGEFCTELLSRKNQMGHKSKS